GGRFGIGTDSNVRISLAEELRILEYAQRLTKRARNVLASEGRSTGLSVMASALAGGAQALGCETGIAPGRPADLVAYDTINAPWISADQVLDHFVFARGVKIDTVWAQGAKRVAGGRHL